MNELAELVGISRQGLYKRLKKAGIDPASLRDGSGLSEAGVEKALSALGVNPCKPVDTEFTPDCQPICKPECQLSTESGEAVDRIEGENPTNCKPVDSEFTRSWHPECQPSTDSETEFTPDCQPKPEAAALPEEAKAPTEAERVEALLKELAAAHAELVEQRHRAELAELKAEAAANERDYLREQLDKAIKANALASMKQLETAENNSPSKGLSDRLRAAWSAIRGKERS